MSVAAVTTRAENYPGFVNATRQDDGSVVVMVRADPKVVDGGYVCGFAADKGQPGRCTPGDANCNNYCNMAPDKGPMADSPLPCRQTHCGATSATRLTAEEWVSFKASLSAI